LKITTDDGTLENATSLVGSIDPGGYFTIDSMLTPDTPGKHTLTLTIEYTDDFNQPRTIEKTLELDVEAAPEQSLGPLDGGPGMIVEESLLHKIWRFIKGLFGLDSAPPGGGGGLEGTPTPPPFVPAPAGKG